MVQASSLPLMMLGGESTGDPLGVLAQFQQGMALGGNVRGAMVGRNILFPGQDDPRAVAAGVDPIIQGGATVEAAIEVMASRRGLDMDRLTRLWVDHSAQGYGGFCDSPGGLSQDDLLTYGYSGITFTPVAFSNSFRMQLLSR